MVLKIINATEARTGTNILIEGEPYTVKKIDISKTGKHGHAKARIEATGIINQQKKESISILRSVKGVVNALLHVEPRRSRADTTNSSKSPRLSIHTF